MYRIGMEVTPLYPMILWPSTGVMCRYRIFNMISIGFFRIRLLFSPNMLSIRHCGSKRGEDIHSIITELNDGTITMIIIITVGSSGSSVKKLNRRPDSDSGIRSEERRVGNGSKSARVRLNYQQ